MRGLEGFVTLVNSLTEPVAPGAGCRQLIVLIPHLLVQLISIRLSALEGRFEVPNLLFELAAQHAGRVDLVVALSKQVGRIASGGQLAAEGLDLFAQAVRFCHERLSFRFQAADFTGSEGFQRLSDCRQLGTLPMVLSPFLIVFRSEPVKLAAKLFELGLDRVAL